MQNPKLVRELLGIPGKRLRELGDRLNERSLALEQVRAAVPPNLTPHILSAGLEHGRLTVGVTSAAWAARLRYSTAALRKTLGDATGTPVISVRIRIIPAGAAPLSRETGDA
jgi:hypothetical protein